jgi:hypothetical protein
MLGALWSGLGGEVAKHWMARILTPAFAFWCGGLLLAWTHRHAADAHRTGWPAQCEAAARDLQKLPGLLQAALVLAALALVTISALAADRMTLPVLRLLEGCWSRPLRVWELMAGYRTRRRDAARRIRDELGWRVVAGRIPRADFLTWLELNETPPADPGRRAALAELAELKAEGELSVAERQRFDRARRLLWRSPEQECTPTRLGDTMRAAERRPLHKYGLDAVACWHALHLVLPAEARTELVQARTALDRAARAWLWGALFALWTPWTPWALPIAAVVGAAVYRVSVLPAAALLGDLLGAAFDLHRFRLYEALGVRRPTGPDDELRRVGPQVSRLLGYGSRDPDLRYVQPDAAVGAR